MRFIVDIEAEVQVGYIQEFAAIIFQEDFSVNTFQLKSRDEYTEIYHINLIYSETGTFRKAYEKVENDPRCIRINCTNILENEIKNGLLRTVSRLSFENEDEFQTNHTGAYQLLKDKITSGTDENSFYYHDAVCCISAIKPVNGIVDQQQAEVLYLKSEKDCAILSRFTDINAFPLVSSYVYNEDFSRMLAALQQSFSLYRIHEITDDDDPDLYIDIIAQSELPVITFKTTELPIMYLHSIFHCMERFKLSRDNVNIGIIGLDSSAVYLTALVNSLKFMRVLGYDENEKSMMHFESRKGLATTRKNILENCDILLVIRDQLSSEDIQNLRPGIIVISAVRSGVTEQFKDHTACKLFLDVSQYDTAILLPGMVRGLMSTQLTSIDEPLIIKIAEILQKKGNQLRITPQLFGPVHDDIENAIVSHSML
ncbi:MAG: hypothetical protein ACOC2H_04690 [Spirochaetota bacterium]